jgi:hypothetical protein
MPLTRAHEIDGRPLKVYDDLVAAAETKRLTDAFLSGSFVCDEVATDETYFARHWQLSIPLETARQLVVFRPTLEALRDFPGCAQYRVLRVYCNHVAYGDMLFTHTDVHDGGQGLTALWYVAPEWNVEWGGETMFYDANMDGVACVTPRPGRLAIFDGRIRHVGRPPNRNCYAPRYTLAFKLEPPPAT